MQKLKCYDLFLTHAWRFHNDWVKFSKLLDKAPGVTWRNFSLPWYDPAIKASTDTGGRFILDSLESQIISVHAVVLLSGVYSIVSARRWFDIEVEMAKKYNKPLIGIPVIGETSVPNEVANLCDVCCDWEPMQLFTTIDQIRSLPKYSSVS